MSAKKLKEKIKSVPQKGHHYKTLMNIITKQPRIKSELRGAKILKANLLGIQTKGKKITHTKSLQKKIQKKIIDDKIKNIAKKNKEKIKNIEQNPKEYIDIIKQLLENRSSNNSELKKIYEKYKMNKTKNDDDFSSII